MITSVEAVKTKRTGDEIPLKLFWTVVFTIFKR